MLCLEAHKVRFISTIGPIATNETIVTREGFIYSVAPEFFSLGRTRVEVLVDSERTFFTFIFVADPENLPNDGDDIKVESELVDPETIEMKIRL